MPECPDCDDDNLCTDDRCAPPEFFEGMEIVSAMCVHEPVDCSDRNDCTGEGCDPAVGCPDPTPVADGTSCAGGTCQGGVCDLTGTVLPCTEQGIRNAIAAGGGPYTFDCDGPQTVTTEAEIIIDNDVILAGEGNLAVDGNEAHRVFSGPASPMMLSWNQVVAFLTDWDGFRRMAA